MKFIRAFKAESTRNELSVLLPINYIEWIMHDDLKFLTLIPTMIPL